MNMGNIIVGGKNRLIKYVAVVLVSMSYHFTICEDCKEEVLLRNGEKVDFSYTETNHTTHTCTGSINTHSSNGMNLMQANAKT